MIMEKATKLRKTIEITECLLTADKLEHVVKEISENETQMEDPLNTNMISAISCRFCKEIFTDSHSFCRHLIFNHFQSLNSCPICSRIFTEIHQLNKHAAKHRTASKLVFKCSSCTMSFYNKKQLKKHEMKHENTDPNEGIYLDDLNTSLTEILRMNIKGFFNNLNIRKPKYNCVSCKITFFNLQLYFQHLKETHFKNIDSDVDKIFICHTCCAVYNNKSALANHIIKKHKSERDIFKCVCCNKEFDEKVKLTLHVRKIHNIYKCSKCNNEYSKNRCYLQHLSKCLGKKCRKLFPCADCSASFKTPNDLYVHNQTCNKRMLDIKDCQFCSMTLPSGEALRLHEKRHKLRTASYKYQCFYCELRFGVPLRLIQHFAGQHRAEKPFKCNICNVTFKKRKEFTYHIKLDHAMEGTVRIDSVNCYILFNALGVDHTKEREETLQVLSGIQKNDTSGTNKQLKTLTQKSKNCTKKPEEKEDNIESGIKDLPINENIISAEKNAILDKNLCKISPGSLSNSENKSKESITINKNGETYKEVAKSNLEQHGDRAMKHSCFICKQNLRVTEFENKHNKNDFRARTKLCLKCVAAFGNRQTSGDPSESTIESQVRVNNVTCKFGNTLQNFNNEIKIVKDLDKKNMFKVHLKSATNKTESAMNLRKYIESFSSNKSYFNNIKSPSPPNNVVLKRIALPVVQPKKFILQTFQVSSNSESYLSNRMLAKPVKFTNNAKLKSNQLSDNITNDIGLKFNTPANNTNQVTVDVLEETSKMIDVSYHKYLEALEKRGTCHKQKKGRGKLFDYVSIIANELSDTALGVKNK